MSVVASKSPMASLLYDSDKGDAGAASEFIARLLNGATAIHMHHLMVTGAGSFAKHTALGVYEGLTEAVDSLAESYIGCTPVELTTPAMMFDESSTRKGLFCANDFMLFAQ